MAINKKPKPQTGVNMDRSKWRQLLETAMPCQWHITHWEW